MFHPGELAPASPARVRIELVEQDQFQSEQRLEGDAEPLRSEQRNRLEARYVRELLELADDGSPRLLRYEFERDLPVHTFFAAAGRAQIVIPLLSVVSPSTEANLLNSSLLLQMRLQRFRQAV